MFLQKKSKIKVNYQVKKITIHSFLNGLNYRSWLNQWTVYSFKYGWDNIQIYLIYISIDTVFRPRRTHQYGSIRQIWILQLVGLEPWILRLWIKHANHCSIKPWWFGNEIGTSELNQLIITRIYIKSRIYMKRIWLKNIWTSWASISNII